MLDDFRIVREIFGETKDFWGGCFHDNCVGNAKTAHTRGEIGCKYVIHSLVEEQRSFFRPTLPKREEMNESASGETPFVLY